MVLALAKAKPQALSRQGASRGVGASHCSQGPSKGPRDASQPPSAKGLASAWGLHECQTGHCTQMRVHHAPVLHKAQNQSVWPTCQPPEVKMLLSLVHKNSSMMSGNAQHGSQPPGPLEDALPGPLERILRVIVPLVPHVLRHLPRRLRYGPERPPGQWPNLAPRLHVLGQLRKGHEHLERRFRAALWRENGCHCRGKCLLQMPPRCGDLCGKGVARLHVLDQAEAGVGIEVSGWFWYGHCLQGLCSPHDTELRCPGANADRKASKSLARVDLGPKLEEPGTGLSAAIGHGPQGFVQRHPAACHST
mmetsp:Transcript_63465/g.175934  ORF Transcript_63465/g.175934 Transcript_63465/m.175934 type:complete len:306 (+) Transcript_63465:81-998(+)